MERLTLLLFCGTLIVCLILDIPLLCALVIGLVIFLLYGRRKHYTWTQLRRMCLNGVKTVKNILITFFLTVIVDLTVDIEVGVVLAIVLFVRRVMQTSNISVLEGHHLAATEDDELASMENTDMLDIPEGVEVY